MQLDKLFLKFGLASSSAELVTLVLVILVLTTIFWLLIGRFRLLNFLINIYISFALLQAVPSDLMGFSKYSSVLIFLILITLLTLLNKYLFDIHHSSSGMALWQGLLMSFLAVVLLLSIIFTFLPSKDMTTYISKTSLSYFIDPWWKLAWMVLPLAFLMFIKKRDK